MAQHPLTPQATKRRSSSPIRRNSSPPILEGAHIITPVDEPGSPTPAPLTRPIPHVEFKTVFKNLKEEPIFFDDPTFEKADVAKSIASFVSIKNGRLQMSSCFREALDVLTHVTGGQGPMYTVVVDELRHLENGVEHSKLTNLQSFIDYQVYKVGEHDRTHDEVKWTNTIATEVMLKVPQVKAVRDEMVAVPTQTLREAVRNRDKVAIQVLIGSNPIDDETLEKAHNELSAVGEQTEKPTFGKLLAQTETLASAPLLAAIESEVGKHYMCRMRYTKPIPGLAARNTAGFIQDRMRFKEIKEPIFLFETSNGVTIAYDSTKFNADKARAQYSGTKKLELTPFNPEEMMIATMQVPVMSEPVALNLQVGNPVRSLSVTIGKKPEEMGYQMTDEPAGVFRRSLNSQRVTEIKWVDDKNLPVCFQMKGAGVPAYGFDMVNAGNPGMGDFTGSEFFKLNAEMGSIGLRSFATSAFGNDRIVPQTLGMVLAADKGSASSSGLRNGAISFRADNSLGVRLENVLSVGEPDAAVKAMRSKVGLDDSEEMNVFKAKILQTMARNLAITHLFGMEYDDSSMKDLSDVGLAGEFSDSGTLRNHALDAPLLIENTTFVSQGVRDMLGVDASSQFPSLYAKQMVQLLKDLAEKVKDPVKTQLADLTGSVETSIPDFKYRLVFLQSLVASLGGPSSAPTPVQQAFYDKEIQGYALALCNVLQGKIDGLDKFRGEQFIKNPASALEAYKGLGFTSLKQLQDVMKPLQDQLGNEQQQLQDQQQQLEGEQKDLQSKVDKATGPEQNALRDKLKALSDNLSVQSYKLKTVNDKIRYAQEALESVARALTPDAADQGKKLFNAALGGENRFKTVLVGLSRQQALDALDTYLSQYRPTIDTSNQTVKDSIDKKEKAAKALIDKLLPQ